MYNKTERAKSDRAAQHTIGFNKFNGKWKKKKTTQQNCAAHSQWLWYWLKKKRTQYFISRLGNRKYRDSIFFCSVGVEKRTIFFWMCFFVCVSMGIKINVLTTMIYAIKLVNFDRFDNQPFFSAFCRFRRKKVPYHWPRFRKHITKLC